MASIVIIIFLAIGALLAAISTAVCIYFTTRLMMIWLCGSDTNKKELKEADVNPEEPCLTPAQIKKMGPCRVQKDLETARPNEMLPNDKVKIEPERRLQFGLGENYEVGSQVEKLVDQEGNAVAPSDRDGDSKQGEPKVYESDEQQEAGAE